MSSDSVGTIFGPYEVIDRLQSKNREIPGIKYAPALEKYPIGEISEADLPMILTEFGRGFWQQDQIYGLKEHVRFYTVKLLVHRSQAEILNNPMQDVARIAGYVGNYWASAENKIVLSDNGREIIVLGGDDGVTDNGYDFLLRFNEEFYRGVEFTLQVKEKI